MSELRCYILCPQACADPAELDMAFSQLQLVEKQLGFVQIRFKWYLERASTSHERQADAPN